jgi:hypothetical protein
MKLYEFTYEDSEHKDIVSLYHSLYNIVRKELDLQNFNGWYKIFLDNMYFDITADTIVYEVVVYEDN